MLTGEYNMTLNKHECEVMQTPRITNQVKIMISTIAREITTTLFASLATALIINSNIITFSKVTNFCLWFVVGFALKIHLYKMLSEKNVKFHTLREATAQSVTLNSTFAKYYCELKRDEEEL